MLTVADLMATLCVTIGQPLSGTSEQQVRNAVWNAWGLLFTKKADWRYFHRLNTLQLYAAQTTGTVEFTLSSRQLTLTDATWPTDAINQHVKLGNAWFPVARRVSSTVLELYENQHPEDDLDEGTTYHIQQVIYPLPYEVGNIVQVVAPKQNIALLQMDLASTLELSDSYGSYTQPNCYTLIASSKHPDRWCLWIPAILSEDTYLQYLFVQNRPRNIIYREARGRVTLASGVATFTDEIVRESWEGCVLRISRNQIQPTGPYGDMPVSDPVFNDDMYEMKITEYLTSTTCRVSDLTTAVATSAPFVVSSHVDVRSGAAEVLMQRLCEDQYGVRPMGNHMEGLTSARRVRDALIDAAAEDAISFRQKDPLVPAWYNLRLRDIAGSVS